MKRFFVRCLALLLISAMAWQPVIVWAGDSYAERMELAEENLEDLEGGMINLYKFCGEPWYKRHMGKLIVGGIVIGGIVFTIATGGFGGPAAVAGGTNALVGSSAAAGLSAATVGGSTVVAAADLVVDSKGNMEIPKDRRQAVYNFYRDNYTSWVNRSSSKKEFGETAIAEIGKFLERNK